MLKGIIPDRKTRRKIDLTGQRFGRWMVLHESAPGRIPCGAAVRRWHVKCDCGNEKDVPQGSLVHGDTTSCGCWQRETARVSRTKHGHTSRQTGLSPTYRSWSGMIQRCTNSRNTRYARYGGRGIVVCPAWLESFERFLADMGERPEGQTVDRIDNDGPYCPFNTCWATAKSQARKRRSSRILVMNGTARCLTELAEASRINEGTLRSRLKLGWTIDRALTEPVRHENQR